MNFGPNSLDGNAAGRMKLAARSTGFNLPDGSEGSGQAFRL